MSIHTQLIEIMPSTTIDDTNGTTTQALVFGETLTSVALTAKGSLDPPLLTGIMSFITDVTATTRTAGSVTYILQSRATSNDTYVTVATSGALTAVGVVDIEIAAGDVLFLYDMQIQIVESGLLAAEVMTTTLSLASGPSGV